MHVGTASVPVCPAVIRRRAAGGFGRHRLQSGNPLAIPVRSDVRKRGPEFLPDVIAEHRDTVVRSFVEILSGYAAE
jgi:hypothetical protein